MKNLIEKFEEAQESLGTVLAVVLILLLVPVVVALPFFWAWVYQQVWNYGIVWVVTQCGGSLPTVGYWAGMGLYLVKHFIQSLFTVKVKKEE